MRYRFIILIISLVLFSKCARVGRPTGGAKDISPPITISATPEFESINFDGNKIKIFFDEFIKFKDLNKQLVVSPPLDYPLEITPLGTASKSIIIKINDTLKRNTTYTFNFGNAIVDNSEGNPLKQFKYFFSTGDYIDSLKILGIVKDAFLQKTASDISILIYKIDSTYTDSIVYNHKPDYIANTLDSISFSITNIKEGKYQLIALKDANKNMLFDPKEDQIAFLNKVVDASIDSTYQLVLFKEKPVFAIKNTLELSNNHVIIGFEGLLNTSIKSIHDKDKKPITYFAYKDRLTDSLHVWHKGVNNDTLQINIKTKDSLDSHFIRLRSKEIDSLEIAASIQHTLHFRDSLFILSNIPITKIDKDKIELIDKDSINVPFNVVENLRKDRFQIDFEKKQNNNYSLTLFPTSVTDFMGHTNDTLHYSIRTKKLEDYGEISLKVVSNTKSPLIIELISNSGKIISRSFLNTTKTLNFSLLIPGKYRIRAIYDNNNNKRWDTGNYYKKSQPERVIYFSKEIDVRANWTISEEFNIKKDVF